MENLYIVMPAYNEEENIEAVVSEWHCVVDKIGGGGHIVVIDDGSKDGTYAKLLQLQATLPRLVAITKPNGGHGAAVLFGYNYALEKNAHFVFQTDSDGQTLPGEFWEFWENRNKYDAQIGFRKNREDGKSRVFVTRVLRIVLYLTFRVWIKDANTPFRLMQSKALRDVIADIPKEHNLANVLVTVFFHKKEKKIAYHPITFRERQKGTNSINFRKIIRIGINACKDFWRMGKKTRR